MTDGLRLRASRAHEVVPLERLAPQARRAAEGAGGDVYGVVRPRGAARGGRVVDRDAALLLLGLREPGPLPAWLARGPGAAARATLRALVLEGLVEIARARGPFASGPGALALLDRPAAPPAGRLAELSMDALRAAARLPHRDAAATARRLYAYNREPLTPAWSRALPDDAAARRFLGLHPRGGLARDLARGWRAAPSAGGEWLGFTPRGAPGARPGVKLYVSPVAADLPAALARLADALAREGPVPFKVARRPGGIPRADKLVAYFPSLDRLRAAAARLAPGLGGLRAQGVPFTGAVAADGLLSWGADPEDRALGSWRAWLCGRLAGHLADAARAGAPDPATEAVARVAGDGVDAETWAPVGASR